MRTVRPTDLLNILSRLSTSATAMFVSDRRWPQLGWPARGPWFGLASAGYTEWLYKEGLQLPILCLVGR